MDARGGRARGRRRRRRVVIGMRRGSIPLRRLSAELRKKVVPVAAIKGVICPRGEATVFLCGGDDELEVLRDVLFVRLKRGSTFPRVVAPRGEELSGNLTVVVPDDFPDEGKLTFCYLVAKRRNAAKK